MRRWILLLAALVATLAGAQDNLLRDPGFEAVAEGAPAVWQVPTYWNGQVRVTATAEERRAGQHGLALRAALKDGKHWGRVLGSQLNASPGLRYRFQVEAKGTGTLKLAFIEYFVKREGNPDYHWVWQEPGVALTDQWQTIAFDTTPSTPDVNRFAVAIEVDGEGAAALLDNADCRVLKLRDGQLSLPEPYQMTTPGQPVEVAVVCPGGGPVTGTVVGPTGPVTTTLTAPATGAVTWRLDPALTAAPGLVAVQWVAADLGAAATAFVDVVDEATYTTFEQAARATKLPKLPYHILFFGDSLTDFYRGYNYTDQVAFWLRRQHGQVSVKNAGIGGDTIVRIWQRLNNDPKVHRAAAYAGLYDTRPDRVFIFVGHNDSKLSSGSNYQTPYVLPEDYTKHFHLVIDQVRQATGAPVTLLSNTSSVLEITRANCDKLVAAGRPASLFGVPATMEQFNALTQEVAKAKGCDYLDVYGPTKQHPDKPSLFMPDGVHINLAGNRLVTLELLRYLAR